MTQTPLDDATAWTALHLCRSDAAHSLDQLALAAAFAAHQIRTSDGTDAGTAHGVELVLGGPLRQLADALDGYRAAYRAWAGDITPATPGPAERRLPSPGLDQLPGVFVLHRVRDPSGISGTGCVMYGVVFRDGPPPGVVTRWRGLDSGVWQYAFWDSLDDLLAVHGHDGNSILLWLSNPPAGTADTDDGR